MEIRKEIESLLDEIIENRRYLHQHPEIELNTLKTKNYIKKQLKSYGYQDFDESLLTNSLVVDLKVNTNPSAIAFRSDIDALPTKEATGVDFASQNGFSHACGHDGHMSALLATAHFMINHRDQLKENIVLIFQPGEESPGGAQTMIANGLFDKHPARYIFGTHLMGNVDAGKIGCKSGPQMARNGEVDIVVEGKSAHGAMPELGKDAIVAASDLIMRFQEIKHFDEDPMKKTVLTIGTINGGQARNVVSDRIEMHGTMRAYSDVLYEQLKADIMRVSKEVETKYGVKVNSVVEDYYLVVDNDEYLHDVLKHVLKEDYELAPAKMIAEDFSFYQREIPGLFFNTGVRDETHQANIHDADFNFDEAALLNTVETNIRLLEALGVIDD